MTTAFPGRKLYHAIRKSREHQGRGICIPVVLNFSFDTQRRPAATPGNHKCPSFHLHYFVNVNCQGALSWPFSPWITYDTPRKIWVQARMCFVCTECSPRLAYESSQNHRKVLLLSPAFETVFSISSLRNKFVLNLSWQKRVTPTPVGKLLGCLIFAPHPPKPYIRKV